MIDYSAASETYDNTRTHSDEVLKRFSATVSLDPSTAVLDFGCGTGNYLVQIQRRFGCRCYGVEPSDGMCSRALAKSDLLTVQKGDHLAIPFSSGMFDFAYMTDVIHHVPSLPSMFRELARVLRNKGALCVVTESHAQIEARFYNQYFPSLAANEKRRYPDVGDIVVSAKACGLSSFASEIIPAAPRAISENFIRNVRERNWSMFRLLSEEEFSSGLQALTGDLGQSVESSTAGTTLLWFRQDAEPLVRADLPQEAAAGHST